MSFTYDARLYTHILHIILVYHSPSVVTHKSQLQQFNLFNYLTLSPTYYTYQHIPGYNMCFNFFRLLSIYHWVYFVYIYIQLRILDYYLPHLVVHNHTHMSTYKSTNLVIHWSLNHITRYQPTILVIRRSPNHITISLWVIHTSYNLITFIALGDTYIIKLHQPNTTHTNENS